MKKEEILARLDAARSVALEASDFLLRGEGKPLEVRTKAENDYQSAMDSATEDLIRNRLSSLFPSDGFYGEESGGEDGRSRWIVDPIDGTVDYMHSFPNYTVSIAYEDEEGLSLGVVSVVRQKELFYAARGCGAYLNGERIHTSEGDDPKKSLMIIVPPHRRHDHLDEYIEKMKGLYSIFSDMRSVGSAACSMCYVASGRAMCYWERLIHLYDVAAGIVILSEAGGKTTITKGENDYIDVAASASSVHSVLLEAIE